MTFCQNCGAALESGASECPRCGEPAAVIPQPYPNYPYPAWQYPAYAAYPAYPARPPGTNTFAIMGFVMAWLPIPFAWLILSIVGLAQCGSTGQKGRGLAIAGILLRVLGTAVLVGGLALLIYYGNSGSYFPEWDWDEGFAFTLTALGFR